MQGISDALHSAANSLLGLERSLALIQGNVGNASTPGYARQDVGAGSDLSSVQLETQSSRDEFAETAVRRQNSQLGHFDQLASTLALVETSFGAGGEAEIPQGIGNLFATFSGLSINPNDTGSRQRVLDRAAQLAGTFNSVSASLGNFVAEGRRRISATVDTINHLAGLVRDYNTSQRNNPGGSNAASLDANLHATLEKLSEFADVQALRQSDGSLTLLLDGQTALVVGNKLYAIQADTTSAPTAAIRDSSGADITAQISGGRLSGSLKAVNRLLPNYRSGLDQLAEGIANQVNGQLAAGVDSFGNPGAPLFTFAATSAAATLSFSGISTGQLAAAAAGAPSGNGNALALASLETSPALNGLTFAGYYGSLAASVGRDIADSRDNSDFQTQLLAQARAQRDEASGVSLDQQAILLVEYQRAYEATAKLVTILDQISRETIDMIR